PDVYRHCGAGIFRRLGHRPRHDHRGTLWGRFPDCQRMITLKAINNRKASFYSTVLPSIVPFARSLVAPRGWQERVRVGRTELRAVDSGVSRMRVPSGRLEVSMAFELAAQVSVIWEVPCVAGGGLHEYPDDPLARAMALSACRAATSVGLRANRKL